MPSSLRFWQYFSGIRARSTNEGMAVRQLAELQRHMLSLYALLSSNACALAFTHYSLAPVSMTLTVPAVLVAFCIVRGGHWWRLRPAALSEVQAVRQLRLTTGLTVVLACAFVAWAITLKGYGGPYEQGHVAIFVAITVVACIFCLTHLPISAFLVTAIVMGVFIAYCLASGNSVFLAIALNTAFVTIVMIRVLSSNFIAFVQLVQSQSDTERLVTENARLAHTDSLTGLPNRRFFLQQLDRLIEDASKDGTQFALAIFDLDSFKPVNDTFGHTAGDRVLAETGQRLTGFASGSLTIARLGGDEFGVLFRTLDVRDALAGHCARICEALQAPIRIGETQVSTGCTGGVALYPSAGRSADELFDRADYALYHAKEHRRGLTTLFSQEHEDAIRAERAVESALRSADLAAEMELHYQPILDTSTDRIVYVEALARWDSSALGRVSPDRFIPAAERGGLIHVITLLLLRKALAGLARLPPDIGLSFNLSSHDLASPGTVISIISAVRESGVHAGRVTLELTETALMRDFDGARQSIDTLRALGVRIALDDFGTGYSSLGYVHRLPLDTIKIDRSFISDSNSELGRSVIKTILDLCQNVGCDGVAEGVETQEQLDTLRDQGCRYVQGYHVGRPMPIGALLERLAARAAPQLELRSA